VAGSLAKRFSNATFLDAVERALTLTVSNGIG
jgi:hypothetical protein